MRFIASLIFFLFLMNISFGQLSAGLSYGTFKVRGNSNLVNGTGPTLNLEYVGDDETQQVYLDISVYNKSLDAGKTEIQDDLGMQIGYAATKENYSIKHLQLGFKRALAGDFTDSRFNCFLGAGGALAFVNVTNKYDLPGYKISNDKISRVLYGFHFNTGMQWRIKPVVVELRGNFDMVLKPIELYGGSDNHSYFLTSTRISVKIPLTKY